MRINIHEAGGAPTAVHNGIAEDTRLSELVILAEDERVYLLDSDEEVDATLTAVEVFGPTGGHAIKHSCKKIDVTVSYSGTVASFHVEPSARVKKVLKKAVRQLGVDAAQVPDLTLRLAGSNDDLPATDPIGAYTSKQVCSVELDLVHLVRPQG